MPCSAFNPPPLAGEVPEGRRGHSSFGYVLIPQLKKHTVQHAFKIVIHVVIPDPVNMPPLRLQEGSSPHIMSDLVVFRMGVSIHFHQQPCINGKRRASGGRNKADDTSCICNLIHPGEPACPNDPR